MAKRNSVLLTKTSVTDAKTGAKRRYVWDRELPGSVYGSSRLALKSFVVKLPRRRRRQVASQRMMTIGRFGPLTAELARRQARDDLGWRGCGR